MFFSIETEKPLSSVLVQLKSSLKSIEHLYLLLVRIDVEEEMKPADELLYLMQKISNYFEQATEEIRTYCT